MTDLLLLLLWMLATYLIGAIPFGYIVGKWHQLDIRNYGSHNIGASNVARVIGKYWGIAVFCLDFLKGYIPAHLTAYYWLYRSDLTPLLQYLSITCLFLPIVGHLYSVFLKFKGGKAVATAAGLLAMLSIFTFLTTLFIFILVFYKFRIVSIASLSAALVMPLVFLASTLPSFTSVLAPFHLTNTPLVRVFPSTFLLSLSILSLIVIIRHKSNIKRLWQKTEPPLK
ncbi:glycerol-3-phosphate acyltransferase [Spirochaetota bacterium]|nr:glycerol-3-phosphate acyltransferase [Spirochaetota bacterium]